MVSVDVDVSESAEQLRRYADSEGWRWRHALATRAYLSAAAERFGTGALNPPSDATLVIDTKAERRSALRQQERAADPRPRRAGAAVMLAADLASAFGVGLAATLSPCALPLYPGFLAYLAASGDRTGSAAVVRWLGLFVLLGVLTMLIALGAVLAIASGAIAGGSAVLRIVITIAAEIVVVGLGALLVLGINPFARLPSLGANVQARDAIVSAYLYGLLYGPIALPCSAALLISIFTLSVTIATFAERMLFFLVFGLGFGMPLFVISLLAPAQQSWLLRQFTRHYAVATRLAGVLLIVVGMLPTSSRTSRRSASTSELTTKVEKGPPSRAALCVPSLASVTYRARRTPSGRSSVHRVRRPPRRNPLRRAWRPQRWDATGGRPTAPRPG